MDRRTFLTIRQPKAAASGTSAARGLLTGLAPYNGPWTNNEVTHLLKRTLFGANKSDIDHFLSLTPEDAVNELLQVTAAVSPPLREYGLLEGDNGSLYDDEGVAIGQTWIDDLNTTSNVEVLGAIDRARTAGLRKWWIGLMLNQTRNISEKMVLFWHHHFSVQASEIGNATMLWRHHRLLRQSALGNVRQLVKDMSIDPAMLRHLNGFLNTKQAPDENYARELQELFTVGKGPGSSYTEADVRAAAKVLTGWRIDGSTYVSYLDTNSHDMSAKSFSAFYGGSSIAGNSSGTTEVDALIDMIYSTNEAARFICRKLYVFFVYYSIDATIENGIIAPLADILIANNFDVVPVLDALFKSEHFFDAENQACYIKSPLDFIIGSLREFDVAVPSYTDYQNGYPLFHALYNEAANMQQDLFQPPDVSGWPAYYQDPMLYEIWVNSNSLPQRARFTDNLISNQIVDTRSFVNNLPNPADPTALLTDAIAQLFRYPLSDASQNWIKNKFLLNNSGNDADWTAAWNANNNTVIDAALTGLFTFLLNLPEYHLS